MAKNKANVKKIKHLMLSQTNDFISYIIYSLLVVAFLMALTIVLKIFLDEVIINGNDDKIILLSILFGGSLLGLIVFLLIRIKNKSNIIGKVASSLSNEAYKALLLSDMNNYKDEDLRNEVKHIAKNSDYIASIYIGKNYLPFISFLIMVIGIVIASFIIKPIFALIILASMPIYSGLLKTTNIFVARYKKELLDTYESSSDKILNTFDNLKNLKLLNGLDYESEKYSSLNKDYEKNIHKSNVWLIINRYVIPIFFLALVIAGITSMGIVLSKQGTNVSMGTYMAFYLLVPLYIISLYQLLNFDLSSNIFEEEALELEKIANLRSEVRSEPVNNLDDFASIKFNNISYSIDKKKILNDINFEINQGEKLGILCDSELSKDAIYNLITKIEKPDVGMIYFNNIEISKINAKCIRDLITSLSYQNRVIGNDSIINNICYKYSLDEYKYNEALYRSGLKQIVLDLPEKDQTKLYVQSDSELNKRVIFANAFYRDSKVYLINEPCKEVSKEIEKELYNEIHKLKNKTIIFETNDVMLLNKCDKVLIIEDGNQVEFGSYVDLIEDKTSNLYKKIANAKLS